MKMLGLAGDKHETTLIRIQDQIEGRGKPKGSEGTTLDGVTGTYQKCFAYFWPRRSPKRISLK